MLSALFVAVPIAHTLTLTVGAVGWPNLRLDQVLVSRPSDMAQAQPHRLVRADRDDLLAYLLQLDGRPPDGTLPTLDLIFANGFETA